MSDPKPRLTALRLANPPPIPPSLQAKLIANANRNNQGPPALVSQNTFPRSARSAQQPPRRLRPNLNLRDIDPDLVPEPVPSGGPGAAGLGAGRPSFPNDQPRRPDATEFASPFSNFSKIVYVPLFPWLKLPLLIVFPAAIPPVHSILAARRSSMRKVSILATAHPSP